MAASVSIWYSHISCSGIGDTREEVVKKLGKKAAYEENDQICYKSRDYYLVIDFSPKTGTARSFLFIPLQPELDDIAVDQFYQVYQETVGRPGNRVVWSPEEKKYAVSNSFTDGKNGVFIVPDYGVRQIDSFSLEGSCREIQWLSKEYLYAADETGVYIYNFREQEAVKYEQPGDFIDNIHETSENYTYVLDSYRRKILFYGDEMEIKHAVQYYLDHFGGISFSDSEVKITTGELDAWLDLSAEAIYRKEDEIRLSADQMSMASQLESNTEALAFSCPEKGMDLMFRTVDKARTFSTVVEEDSGYSCNYIRLYNGVTVSFRNGQSFVIGSDLGQLQDQIDFDEQKETWYYGEASTNKIIAVIDDQHFVFVADEPGDFSSYEVYVGDIGKNAVKEIPDFPEHGGSLDDFIPDGWELKNSSGYVEEDFNGDGRKDIAAVITVENYSNIGLGEYTDQSILLVLIRENEGYRLDVADPYILWGRCDINATSGGFSIEWGYAHHGTVDDIYNFCYIDDEWFLVQQKSEGDNNYRFMNYHYNYIDYLEGIYSKKYTVEDHNGAEIDALEFQIQTEITDLIRLEDFSVGRYRNERSNYNYNSIYDDYPVKKVTMLDTINIAEEQIPKPASSGGRVVVQSSEEIIYQFSLDGRMYLAVYTAGDYHIHVFYSWIEDKNTYSLETYKAIRAGDYIYVSEYIMMDGNIDQIQLIGIRRSDGSTKTVFTTAGKTADYIGDKYSSLTPELFGNKIILYAGLFEDSSYYYCVDLENGREEYLGSISNLY